MGLAGFRRAVASLVFAAHGLLWLLNSILAPPEMRALTIGMTLVYAVAYFSVSAEAFWGRWFGMGLCYYGSILLVGLLRYPELAPVWLILGGSHVVALACLYGSSMASRYEGAPEWRLTFNVDEDSSRRLGRSVQSAATTIPILILQLLGPREESSIVVLTVLGLATAGMFGMLRLKTWSLLALGAAGTVFLTTLALPAERFMPPFGFAMDPTLSTAMLAIGAAGLIVPMLVWAKPLRRSLRA